MPGYLMFQIPAEGKNAHGEMYTPGGMPDPQMGPRGSASYTHPHVGIIQRMSCPHDCLLRDPCVPVSLDLQHCHLGKECSHVCTWPSLGSVLEGFPKGHPMAGWQLWSSSPGHTAQPGSGSPGLPSAPQPLRPCPRGPFLTYRSSPGCSQVPGRVDMGGCSLGTMQTGGQCIQHQQPHSLPGQAVLGSACPPGAAQSVPAPCVLPSQGCHSPRRKRRHQ